MMILKNRNEGEVEKMAKKRTEKDTAKAFVKAAVKSAKRSGAKIVSVKRVKSS